MQALVIIPARMAASRLPGKPLAEIGGVPMIVRALRCAEAAGVGPVWVAAGDREIVQAVETAGGRAVLTDPALPSGTDRVRAALAQIGGSADAVINLQGDMPFVAPQVLTACLRELARPDCDIATVVTPEASPADRSNPSVVKAVLAMDADGAAGRALYFTRSTLYGDDAVWRHVGIYSYRTAALERFCAAPPSPLERRESLEQLRALELGLTIRAAVVEAAPLAVDTPEDLAAARAWAETHGE